MRTQSAETQLRRTKSELKRLREDARVREAKLNSMVIEIVRLAKTIDLTRGELSSDDWWRPHFESWLLDLEAIRKIRFRLS